MLHLLFLKSSMKRKSSLTSLNTLTFRRGLPLVFNPHRVSSLLPLLSVSPLRYFSFHVSFSCLCLDLISLVSSSRAYSPACLRSPRHPSPRGFSPMPLLVCVSSPFSGSAVGNYSYRNRPFRLTQSTGRRQAMSAPLRALSPSPLLCNLSSHALPIMTPSLQHATCYYARLSPYESSTNHNAAAARQPVAQPADILA